MCFESREFRSPALIDLIYHLELDPKSARSGLTKSVDGDAGNYISYLRTSGVSLMSGQRDYAI